MKILPIPIKLLPHSISYAAYSGSERYGDSWADPDSVDHVRVVPSSQVTASNLSQQTDYSYLVIIDSVHTSPQITPTEKSKVDYGDLSLKILKVNECWAENKLHHWECECS
ncbi:MAG: putative minor capsid protein [Sporolactobacillus sp.]